MNFLNSAYLSRYGRAAVRGSSNPWGESMNIDPGQSQNNPSKRVVFNHNSNNSKQLKTLYFNRFTLTSKPTLWTQVRSSKSYPRFHRDIEYPNFDDYRKDPYKDVRKTTWGQGDQKPGISYTLAFGLGVSGMYAVKSVATYFISSMSAAADVLALASVEVDLSKVAPGACDIVKWRGKPLFIKHRTEADIELEKSTNLGLLRDPESPEIRCQKQQWLIVIGICTHLGCVPIANVGDFPGGFYCPCHGSHYDNLGRIRKGPAPTNLVIPPYKYTSDTQIVVG